ERRLISFEEQQHRNRAMWKVVDCGQHAASSVHKCTIPLVQDYAVAEEPPTHTSKILKFGKGAHPESVTFSPSGQ
ncbi:hypothetical protein Pmar_PMAR013516, partial [Perkinsus marinus ATCC 50983]